jgi:hypothetical protein
MVVTNVLEGNGKWFSRRRKVYGRMLFGTGENILKSVLGDQETL